MKLLAPLLRKFGYAPIAARRNFSAAQSSRLTSDWSASGVSLNSILSTQGQPLRARAKALRDNEYFKKFLWMLVCNTIGANGMTLKNKAMEPPSLNEGKIVPGALDVLANTLIEWAWLLWGTKENCTTTKKLTWTQVQNLAIREFGTVGETLWRMRFGAEADNIFGFALEPIAIDRLHSQSNYNLSNGNKVRMGVETNAGGKIIAYWITDTDPTDVLWNVGNAYDPKRYPAELFVHPFIMEETAQVRGYPWAAASMLRMKMLQGYDEASIVGARAAASKMAFITKTGTGVEYEGPNAQGGGKYMDAEPGLLEELPQGMDVKVVDWNQPNANYDPFIKACVRGMANGLLVSYPNLGNDYGEVNFSAGRMARQEETEVWKMVQAFISADFHEPIFSNWLKWSLLSQAIKFTLASGREIILPASKYEKFNEPQFHGRRWDWVDPTKEVAALAEELRLKLTSVSRICANRGIDRDVLFDEIKDDKEAAASRGIVLPDEAELAAAAQRLAEKQDTDAPQVDADGNPIESEDMNGEQFKSLVDGYGVAVRAGAITPNEEDEKFFRDKLGMAGNSNVASAWKKDKGVRRPITLVQEGVSANGQPIVKAEGDDDGDTNGNGRSHLNGK